MIRIDGSDGGGAVVRTAVGLAAATQQEVKITNIRANRPQPGLKAQHIAGIEAVKDLTDADSSGLEQGRGTLTFAPQERVAADDIRVNIPTAGAVGLALQPLQIALYSTQEPVSVTVDGGATAGKWAPPVPFQQNVTAAVLKQHGIESDITMKRHGFYPEGGALTDAAFNPSTPEPFELVEQGDVETVHGISIASQHLRDSEVADRQRNAARKRIADENPSWELDIATEYVETRSPGSVIVLWAETAEGSIIGGDALGEKGKRSEAVGDEAAEELLRELDADAAVDRWTADQLVPFLALCGGKIRTSTITDHLERNVAVAEKFVENEIQIEEKEGVVEAI